MISLNGLFNILEKLFAICWYGCQYSREITQKYDSNVFKKSKMWEGLNKNMMKIKVWYAKVSNELF